MIELDLVATSEDQHSEVHAERGLISAVIWMALSDANGKNLTGSPPCDAIRFDAVDFLMTERSDPYFDLIGINPEAAREALLRKSEHFVTEYEGFRYWYRVWRNGKKRMSPALVKAFYRFQLDEQEKRKRAG